MTDCVPLSPEDVAETLGTSSWRVREQARRGRIPHLHLGKGHIRLLPEHLDALVALFTVESGQVPAQPTGGRSSDLTTLGATLKSLTAHRRHPYVQGDGRLF